VKLLLDTHTFLWSMSNGRLSAVAQQAFLNPENDLFFSAASYWEICIKVSIGKLQMVSNWSQLIDREMQINAIRWLPIEQTHCLELLNLPFHHSDPFDRLLIAQATYEGMTLVTADQNIGRYAIPTLW
jgi:PIN domain nuclease of toxin-antitoxin system